MQSTSMLVKIRNWDYQSLALYNQGICITSVSEIPVRSTGTGTTTRKENLCVCGSDIDYTSQYLSPCVSSSSKRWELREPEPCHVRHPPDVHVTAELGQ